MDRETFDEVEEVRDRDEQYTQGRINKLIELHVELHDEELAIAQNQRAEKRDIRALELAEIREELTQRFESGVLTCQIQRMAAETKNRKSVNKVISEVKTHSQDVNEFITRALEVLEATQEQYARAISQTSKNKTKTHLTQVGEKLNTISLSMNNIEELLVRFELEDVEIGGICRQIKTQNSSFGHVLASLKRDMLAGEIGFRNVEDFKDHGKRLYQMINCMMLISEDRIAVVEAIRARHNATMPDFRHLRIEN